MSDVTQALGAVGGAMAIMEVMPPKYRHMIGGPVLKVDLHTGAIAEGVLTFVITFVVLFIIIKGPRSEFLKTLMMSISTVAVIVAGSAYTGPSMNPILVSDSFFTFTICYPFFSCLNSLCYLYRFAYNVHLLPITRVAKTLLNSFLRTRFLYVPKV